jgi:hypothetical protein
LLACLIGLYNAIHGLPERSNQAARRHTNAIRAPGLAVQRISPYIGKLARRRI